MRGGGFWGARGGVEKVICVKSLRQEVGNFRLPSTSLEEGAVELIQLQESFHSGQLNLVDTDFNGAN